MTIGTLCSHKVITVDRDIDIAAAANVMRENHLGYLIVTDATSGGGSPVGVITDRDIVIKVTAKDVDPHSLTVGDVMTAEPLIAAEDDGVSETLHRMRRLACAACRSSAARPDQRRAVAGRRDRPPVAQMSDVAGSITNEQKFERALRT
jgi:CBS domain-containing protein